MADVWTALDEVLTRRVALKVLRREVVDDPVLRERFRREAQLAARLNHRCVVAIYDTITDEQAPGGPVEAVVQELVAGETLKDALDQRRRVPVANAVRIGIAVADALDAVHRAGIVHRDVKPANILLADDGRVLLTDFGIATHGRQDLTRDDVMMGTAKYLSPEQVEGRPATTAADLYSLGVVLYECLAGRAPFSGESEAATALARLRADAIPLRAARPGVPHRLAALVAACMARRPADRPLSAAVVRQSLTRLAPTIVDDDAGELPPLRPRFSGQRRRAARDRHSARHDAAPSLAAPPVEPPPAGEPGDAPDAGRRDEGHSGTPAADTGVPSRAASGDGDLASDRRHPNPTGPNATAPTATRRAATERSATAPAAPRQDDTPATTRSPGAPDRLDSPLPPATARPHDAERLPSAAARSHREVGRRRWYWRLAHAAVLVAVIAGVVAIVVSVAGSHNAGAPRDLGEAPIDLAPTGEPASNPPASAATTVAPVVVAPATSTTVPATSPIEPAIVSAAEFDPPPGDGKENPALLTRLFDHDPRTFWTSLCYDDPAFGEKEGIGIVFELSADVAGRRLEVTSSSRGWSASVYVAPTRPDRLKAWGPPVASQRDVTEQTTMFALGSASGRYVLLWFTRLGASEGCRLPFAVRVGEARILPVG